MLLRALREALMRIHKITISRQPPKPSDPAAKRKRWEKFGARLKNPYDYQKLSDKDIPMQAFP